MQIKKNDPTEAKKFFLNKLTFTTGPVEVKYMIEENAPIGIIDVRAREDYEKGHIPGAVNLPEKEWATYKGLKEQEQNYVYCYSIVCHLAARACHHFASKGFSVAEIEGGFESWKENQLPIEQ